VKLIHKVSHTENPTDQGTHSVGKTFENHQHSVAVFIFHFNFSRIHSTYKQTPAMAAGLTDHSWNIENLLKSTL